MDLLDYISQIGGLLGLFIGFSVISALEIFYWITFRLVRNKLSSSSQRSNEIQPTGSWIQASLISCPGLNF